MRSKFVIIGKRLRELWRQAENVTNSPLIYDASNPLRDPPDRSRGIHFKMKRTTYFDFYFNTRLDEPFVQNGQTTTPRQVLGLYGNRISMWNLRDYPFLSFRMGTGTVVITRDNKIVVPVRSKKDMIAGAGYHLSVAEGMYEVDVQACIGKYFNEPITRTARRDPSVVATSVRGLKDELGLVAGEHYDPNDLLCLGVLFDVRRLQPYVVFYLKCKRDFERVHHLWERAADRWENIDVLGLDWNEHTAEQLVKGRGVRFNGQEQPLASNHALAGYMLAADLLLSKRFRKNRVRPQPSNA